MLKVTLKQHTPIIHFQYDQVGATLRATELKPKLDKFLIANAFQNELEQYGRFKIGGKDGQFPALDYKIRILPNGNLIEKALIPEKKEQQQDTPLFFGNIGPEYKKNPKGLKRYEGASIRFFSFHPELIERIDEHIDAFFASTNFGMRQSKGYGSFTTDRDYEFPSDFYRFKLNVEDETIMFKTIDLFYKSLRSGVNGGIPPNWDRGYTEHFYMKPMIFLYAKKEHIQWEKKTIKENFFKGKLLEHQSKRKNLEDITKEDQPNWPLWYHETNKDNQKIVRDLLGLSSEQSWKGYGYGDGAKITKTHIDQDKKPVKSDDAIARFKSPILFKPVKNADGKSYTIYFKAENIPTSYLQARFLIENGADQFPLSMWETFDIHQFLEFAFKEVAVESSMKYEPRDRAAKEIATTISRIYKEIRQNC